MTAHCPCAKASSSSGGAAGQVAPVTPAERGREMIDRSGGSDEDRQKFRFGEADGGV